jgi:two-component system chemotaxis response regulator CheB
MTSAEPSAADHHDLLVVGASAGGVDVLQHVVAALPHDLPAAVLVVLHVTPAAPSALPGILDRSGPLPAVPATDGRPLEPGVILVAPPDRHLVVDDGHVRLLRTARENGHRPAIDPLFRSAAIAHGPRVVGAVLSGMLDDGAIGLAAIAAAGGLTAVQRPDDARYPSMPARALAAVPGARSASGAEMGGLLLELIRAPLPSGAPSAPAWVRREQEYADDPGGGLAVPPGETSAQTCPACGGSLWESEEGGVLRYRCRVGHAWSSDSLYSQSASALENALWTAMRTLEERAGLARRMALHARESGNVLSARQFEASAADAERRREVVRAALAESAERQADALDALAEGAGP